MGFFSKLKEKAKKYEEEAPARRAKLLARLKDEKELLEAEVAREKAKAKLRKVSKEEWEDKKWFVL